MACMLAASACFSPYGGAQTDAGQQEDAGPQDPPVAGGLRIGPPPAPPESTLAAASGFGWTVAPIRWGGDVSSELRVVGVQDQPRRVQRIDRVQARAATYLWQPWFVQVSGGLGVFASHDMSGTETGADSGGSWSVGNSTMLTGNGAVSVFPASRFPFNARYERSDSRTGDVLTSADYTTTRASVSQDYRPANTTANFAFRRDWSVYDSASLGRDALDVWDLRLMGQSGNQHYDVNANRSSNSRSRDGESQLDRLNARHLYREGGRVSVESLAGSNSNEFVDSGLAGTVQRSSRFRQLSSFANWRPTEGSPWYVTGGGRLFLTEVEQSGTRAETRTLSGNLGANYQWTPKTTLSGIVTVTEVLTDVSRDLISTEGLNVTHIPDIVPLGPFLYGRTLNAGTIHEQGGPEGRRRALTGQFAHDLTRSMAAGSRATISLNLAQSLTATEDTLSGTSTTFLNSVGTSWSAAPSPASSAYAALTAADSRRQGVGEGDFQLVNLQANGQFQFSRYALGSASLTAQATRANTPLAHAQGFDTNTAGNLSYQHARVLGVPGLRYSAILTINDSQLASRQSGDLSAPVELSTQTLEQRLDYNIGRLETRLVARYAEIQGRWNSLVFLRLIRWFGAY